MYLCTCVLVCICLLLPYIYNSPNKTKQNKCVSLAPIQTTHFLCMCWVYRITASELRLIDKVTNVPLNNWELQEVASTVTRRAKDNYMYIYIYANHHTFIYLIQKNIHRCCRRYLNMVQVPLQEHLQ